MTTETEAKRIYSNSEIVRSVIGSIAQTDPIVSAVLSMKREATERAIWLSLVIELHNAHAETQQRFLNYIENNGKPSMVVEIKP